MARTKNRPDTATSATHAAPDPAPEPGTAPAPDSPAAAVHAALAANPGSAVAAIAGAAGTGRPAAREALLAMERAGTATRAKGSKPGIADTWTLADVAQDDVGPEDEQAGQPGDSPGSLNGPGHDVTAGTASPGQRDAEAGTGPGTEQPVPDDVPAGDEDAAASPGQRDAETAPDSGAPQDPDDAGAAREDAVPEDAEGEAGEAPDPALTGEVAERIAQIKAAADAAAIVLTGDTDLRAALAGLDEIAEQAAQARRSLKAAIGGRKAPAVRPGGLRDKVLAHLDAHPDKEFTPHEIHKVLSHSSGAIANALETLVKLGEAEVATEKPRRFRRASKPAGAASGPEGADSAHDEGTELAGAA